jgi:hypothetical protein
VLEPFLRWGYPAELAYLVAYHYVADGSLAIVVTLLVLILLVQQLWSLFSAESNTPGARDGIDSLAVRACVRARVCVPPPATLVVVAVVGCCVPSSSCGWPWLLRAVHQLAQIALLLLLLLLLLLHHRLYHLGSRDSV